jgi:uncharacterized protein (TIGR00375 family)
MMLLDADLHLHGRYSGGTSSDMNIPSIAGQAALKGLSIVATADALHPGWLSHMADCLKPDGEGLYYCPGHETRFIVQTEVEDACRVHHIILLPDIESAKKLSRKLGRFSKNIAHDGRPNISLTGEQIAGYVRDLSGLIGPSHAFTPWTSLYKEYDSIMDCYGGNFGYVDFLELGLSANTDYADRVGELSGLTFLSNSDCHSPWPHRLGREFNRIKVEKPSFDEVARALRRQGGRCLTLNAGLNPLEGKYHLSACTRCFLKFSWQDALRLKRRCPECNGLIKKGVVERIGELADTEKPIHPGHRPPYVHILPLAEVIGLATNTKTVTAKSVMRVWNHLVGKFGTEISILLDADLAEIASEDSRVAQIIGLIRGNQLKYVAGGGGKYGHPTLSGEKDRVYEGVQKRIGEY